MLDQDGQRALLRLAGVAATAGFFLWFLNREAPRPRRLGAGSLEEERRKLVPLLRELSRRFFTVCMDVASVAKTVRVKIEAGKVDITDPVLREQLSRQCKVFEKLADIQAEVAPQFGCTVEELQELQQLHFKDPEVRTYVEGFKTMLDAALGGEMPVFPNVKIPEELTEEKVLQILAEVYAQETKKVIERVGGKQVSVKDLGEVLSVAHRDAWDDALEANRAAIGEGREVYHSALALYMKVDSFAAKRKKIDVAHQKRMLKLFQPEAGGTLQPTA